MTSRMAAFKSELDQRYWEYQASHFPEWQRYFDRPRAERIRPPVFVRREAWRNVILKPGADQQETDRVLALLPKYERHKWFRSMNSSQALAQSVFGNLAIYDRLTSLTELTDDDGMPLFGRARVTPENFVMEYNVDTLGEPRRTSLDGYFEGDYRVAIECKFTEAKVGACSRSRLRPRDSNYESDHCNSTYSRQRGRKARCSLTEIGVMYWRYIPHLFSWQADRDMSPCPLAANYQLVRNVLAVGVDSESASTSRGHAVLIYDERNPAFQPGGAGFHSFVETKMALREPAMLRKCSWQQITRLMRDEGMLPWLMEQLELKYGL